MPPWPIAMPSSTAMVLNSLETPPASAIAPATRSPMFLRWTWPGTNCVYEFAIAMIGLPKSPLFMPVARQSARAPAMLRPWVEVRERRGRMASCYAAMRDAGVTIRTADGRAGESRTSPQRAARLGPRCWSDPGRLGRRGVAALPPVGVRGAHRRAEILVMVLRADREARILGKSAVQLRQAQLLGRGPLVRGGDLLRGRLVVAHAHLELGLDLGERADAHAVAVAEDLQAQHPCQEVDAEQVRDGHEEEHGVRERDDGVQRDRGADDDRE